jgi:signal transduction histidine kinase/DNA-binding response OmpR family regulator/HAMP domain-containing protein
MLQKFKSSIALKLNIPIIFLGLILFIFLYVAYVYQTRSIIQYQLKQLAETMSDNIIISAATNLKSVINALAVKHNISRIIVIKEENQRVIADNQNTNIGKTILQSLPDNEQVIYKILNSKALLTSSEFIQNTIYYLYKTPLINTNLKKLPTYYIFIVLDESETFINAPNILGLITTICMLGMVCIFLVLYLLQRCLLLKPLDQITQHLTTQNNDNPATPIPLKSADEIGRLVDSYNELIENKNKHDIELESTHRYIDGIANTAPVLLSYIGSDLKFKFVNQLHEDWFGIPIDIFEGSSLKNIIGEDTFNKIRPEIEKVLSGENTSFEESIPYQYLDDKLVQINFVPDKNLDNNIDGFFVCIDDLSETRRNETKLADYAQKLEYREYALENEKLIAEQALKIKSEFLASMSHEIRTPMNGVLGMLSLLMDTNLTEDQQVKASLAKTSSESLLTLINDILDFSKVESGKLEIEKIDFNLIEILENTTEGLSKLAQDKAISLLIDTSEVSQAWVKGDPGRLRQVLNNLLFNAIKFTHTGEVIITASLSKEASGSVNLICKVSDTGIGIEQDKLASIFDSFTQVDASTTRQYGGTGLGLAIAKKLCQLMGGDIQATSAIGHGSTFTCSLTLEQSDHQLSRLESKELMPIDLSGSNFLIIDPNQANLDICTIQLTKWGAKTRTVSTSDTALSLMKNNPPSTQQFVLVSLELDDKSGLDLVKELKVILDTSNIKFILMAPLEFKHDQKYIQDLGFCDYFFKPLTQTKLRRAINKTKLSDVNRDTTEDTTEDAAMTEIILPKNKRILLVEDTPINQLVVEGILSSFDLSCEIAGNGLEALEMLKNVDKLKPYDIILMDCQMPEMDGYEATKEIREGKAGELSTSIPIIAMTANAMKGDEELCIQAGMNDYMSKPVDPDIIKEKLAKWLS